MCPMAYRRTFSNRLFFLGPLTKFPLSPSTGTSSKSSTLSLVSPSDFSSGSPSSCAPWCPPKSSFSTFSPFFSFSARKLLRSASRALSLPSANGSSSTTTFSKSSAVSSSDSSFVTLSACVSVSACVPAGPVVSFSIFSAESAAETKSVKDRGKDLAFACGALASRGKKEDAAMSCALETASG
ncbi:hypothetical protein TGRUB_433020 [Toxoplasma gondii RUB]|uniref:Uncharacterized protein n=1 Tax=Toxoplasma gondii RUB TaxID=935652 RepID=A0A086LNG9_TOXGO|nr:hypothetical protein TGRUB_433020 [Toxoplasma gondii RUB]